MLASILVRRVKLVGRLARHFFATLRRSSEKRVAIEAWIRLAGAKSRLYFFPQATIRKAIAPPRATSLNVPPSLETFLAVANTHPIGISCLSRAIALRSFLEARGVGSSVAIGVRRGADGKNIEGHAWVEVDGAVVGDDPRHVASYVAYNFGPRDVAGLRLDEPGSDD